MNTQERWHSSMQNNYGVPALTLVKGKGVEVWDEDGKRYLDFLGGIATNILGHAHPEIVKAVSKQIAELSHVSNLYVHTPGIELAEKLQDLTNNPSSRIFFCNSGAEANEAAIKISRLTGRKGIVAALGGVHGRTTGALSITAGGRLILNQAFPRALLPFSCAIQAFQQFLPTIPVYIFVLLAGKWAYPTTILPGWS
jgi:acetylornithine aminotransferase